MCGIAGWVSRVPAKPEERLRLLAMREALHHRGPDDAGDWMGNGCALASRRLSVLDLSERGHMPMASNDGRYRIVHNGEVYNYRELRPVLETKGWRFGSDTDTEVILALYAHEGPAMLSRLNGMFAFAIWDDKERTLFLARDRLGIKPLYLSESGGRLFFASEEKAFFEAGVPAAFDPATWEELLLFRYVAGERTPLLGIKRLLPGHWLLWRDGREETKRWWHLGERAAVLRDCIPGDPVAWYRETFDDAIRLRRISDVPIGIFLSGGLDSSVVAAALALQSGPGLRAFNMGFPEKDYDESPLAASVVRRWSMHPHYLTAVPAELSDLILNASRFNDEPLAHGNDVYLLQIAQYAKPLVTVLLSGEGADETLGGYVRYQPLRHPMLLALLSGLGVGAWLPRGASGRIAKLARFLREGGIEELILYNACNLLPSDLRVLGLEVSDEFTYRRLVLDEARRYSPEPVRQAMYLDQHTFLCSLLDRNDRMTMGASIECRVPFLDWRLVEMAAALPSGALFEANRGKAIARRAFADRLPAEVLKHPKWGFGMPWGKYLRSVPELRRMLMDLPCREPVASGPFEKRALSQRVERFLGGHDDDLALLLELLTVTIWHRVTCEERRKPAMRD